MFPAVFLGSNADSFRWGGLSRAMFQSLHISPPRCPPDGFYADTSVHLEIADPALVANWLLAFLRGRCVFVRIDFVKCTLRVRINESLIKLRIFYDVMNTTPVSVSPREGGKG